MQAGPAAAVAPSTALRDLNAMRVQAGLPSVRGFHGKLNRGCKLHNRYMSRTGEFGHLERRSSRYFTKLGARAASRSVFAAPGLLPSEAWGQTVYHRLAILQPRLRVSGFSAHAGFSCLQVLSGVSGSPAARTPGLTLYPWPANGSAGHAPVFPGYESPNPLLDAPGAARLGTPLTVVVNGPWRQWQVTRSAVDAATLVGDSGVSVPLSVSDRGSRNARYLQGGFALLPRQALAANAWYTATASGRVYNRGRSWPFTLTTRFRTGAVPR
ncbi:MAG: hypothetical protein HZB14_00945 [Actinobacteria bacterium]|nr:hypothetical protein [Actinomycetota bacterium]